MQYTFQLLCIHFNPRSRMGSDRSACWYDNHCKYISIHAPAWGATFTSARNFSASKHFNPRSRMGSDTRRLLDLPCKICYFNPRSRMGSDPVDGGRGKPSLYFNPRSRMGSDDQAARDSAAHQDFNPRSRMGSDVGMADGCIRLIHFNPRSRMGSDKMLRRYLLMSRISIHAPAWGATETYLKREGNANISIHAPAWGATMDARRSIGNYCRFQSTLPHGERRGAYYTAECRDTISIHAPAWGATNA